ncbi:MAG: 1,4-dihydroxy-2-naphthoate octaprenyltransferase, partial [Flavobacteriia bacterium]|nr:1,4-dihydroxy-2-naphthoate octaprenyltransferase [Flavobacteriia bacterium]
MDIKSWIAAARLRTLPLAFSCIILGNFLANSTGQFRWSILIWSLLTTLLYQVLSNFANDYGDGVKGTDDGREGEKRAVASGDITASGMKKAVILFAILSWLSGAWLSYLGTTSDLVFYIFLGLNTAAVVSAIRYTVGGSAYGYRGLGDVYVILFFGLIGVLGSYYLQTGSIKYSVLLPGFAVGMLATGVLNLNNMRDIENDKKHGKQTVPVRIGLKSAKVYHSVLLFGSQLLMAAYVFLEAQSGWAWLFALISPVVIIQWRKAMQA